MEKPVIKIGVLVVGDLVSKTYVSTHVKGKTRALGDLSLRNKEIEKLPSKIEVADEIYDISNAVIIKSLESNYRVYVESLVAQENSSILATGNIIARGLMLNSKF